MSQTVPGLKYIPDVIDCELEAQLIEIIESNSWSRPVNRSVQQYGYYYDYSSRTVTDDPVPEIPDLFKKIVTDLGYKTPEQCIVNKYEPGEGISPHTDHKVWFSNDRIISLSLGSDVTMDFECIKNGSKQKESIRLLRRSVVVMEGESRNKWTHGIRPIKSDLVKGSRVKRGTRISITFRWLNPKLFE